MGVRLLDALKTRGVLARDALTLAPDGETFSSALASTPALSPRRGGERAFRRELGI